MTKKEIVKKFYKTLDIPVAEYRSHLGCSFYVIKHRYGFPIAFWEVFEKYPFELLSVGLDTDGQIELRFAIKCPWLEGE